MLLPEKLDCVCPFPTLEHAIRFLSSRWLNHYTLQYKYDSAKLVIPSFPLLSSLCVWGIGLVCKWISFWWIRPIVLMVRLLLCLTFPDVVSLMNGSWTFLSLHSVPLFRSFSFLSFYLWFIWHCSSTLRIIHTLCRGIIPASFVLQEEKQKGWDLKVYAKERQRLRGITWIFLRAFSRPVRGLDPKGFPSDLRFLICLWVLLSLCWGRRVVER